MKTRQQYKTMNVRRYYTANLRGLFFDSKLECFEYQIFLISIGAAKYICKRSKHTTLEKATISLRLIQTAFAMHLLLTK